MRFVFLYRLAVAFKSNEKRPKPAFISKPSSPAEDLAAKGGPELKWRLGRKREGGWKRAVQEGEPEGGDRLGSLKAAKEKEEEEKDR